jgi:hypothetical protein
MFLINKKSIVKIALINTLVLCCVLLIGCDENQSPAVDKGQVNKALVNTYNDMAIQNAIITQHTLFPYHFVQNSANLNELGERDLAILAGHLRDNPGNVNVRRAGNSSGLYQQRVSTVLDSLKAHGVDTARITIADAMPGGDGMVSERVIVILEADYSDIGSTSKGTGAGASMSGIR